MTRKPSKLACSSRRSIAFVTVILLILFGAGRALAQDISKHENKTIRAIKQDIKPSSSLPAGTQVSKKQRHEVLQILRANMKSRIGAPYSSDILNKDIKRIVAKGQFWMKVEVVPVPDGVEIKLDITLRPIVKKVLFTDHKGRKIKPPHELLLEIITKNEAYFSKYFITRDQRIVEEHYRDQGYPLVRVRGEAKYTDEGVTVTFQVWKGLYVIMRVINFEGRAEWWWRDRIYHKNQESN